MTYDRTKNKSKFIFQPSESPENIANDNKNLYYDENKKRL